MSLIKVTKNGEITFDSETKVYQVWNETYSDIVAETICLDKAYEILESYCVNLEKIYG